MNFGGIGMVIGHELTHGFDDQGRKFDPEGNLRDWWTAQDGTEFEKRASCIADEYSSFVAVDDLKLNGKLTLGENTADNGGARIALMALEQMIADGQGEPRGTNHRRLHPAAAFLPGLRARLVRKTASGILAHAGQRRSSFAGKIPRERRSAEHARIPEGIQLQSRTAHGARRTPAGCGRPTHGGGRPRPPSRAQLDSISLIARRSLLRRTAGAAVPTWFYGCLR